MRQLQLKDCLNCQHKLCFVHTLKLLNSPKKVTCLWDFQRTAFECMTVFIFLARVGSDSASLMNLIFHCHPQQGTDCTKGSDTQTCLGVRVCLYHRNRLNLRVQERMWWKGITEKENGEIKKACGTPCLLFVLSSTELSLCYVTGWLSHCWAAPACIDPVWLAKNNQGLLRSSFSLGIFLFQPYSWNKTGLFWLL